MKDQILTIDTLGKQGEGIAYFEEKPVYIDLALPGEQVKVQFIETKSGYYRGELLEIISPSSQRRAASCSVFKKCGGCQIMHMSPSSQLDLKQGLVKSAFEKFSELKKIEIETCVPSEKEFSYRNKMVLPVRGQKGALKLGLFEKRSQNLVEITSCPVHNELGEKIFATLIQLLKKSKVEPYDPSTHLGSLKFVQIKTGIRTQEVLVSFILRDHENNAELEELSKKLQEKHPEVKGIVFHFNATPGNTILKGVEKVVSGSENILETIAGLHFKISTASFFQVNPFQAEKIYLEAIQEGDFSGSESVLDAFCGVGGLALICASQVKEVLGVECVPSAIVQAKTNAELNQIRNVEFVCGKSEEVISSKKNWDIVFINPPRKGCERDLLETLLKNPPKKIIYISCSPSTLARDLAFLSTHYHIKKVKPFDLFPQTIHVETLVTLERI